MKSDDKKSIIFVNLNQLTTNIISHLSSKQSKIGILIPIKMGETSTSKLKNDLIKKTEVNLYNLYNQEVSDKKTKNILKEFDIIVCCSQNSADIENHQRLNSLSKSLNKEFLSVRMTKTVAEIGPHVIPEKTACFNCFENRIKANIPFWTHIPTMSSANSSSSVSLEKFRLYFDIIANFTTVEILKLLNKEKSFVTGSVFTINFSNNSMSIDPVLKVPTCQVCFG